MIERSSYLKGSLDIETLDPDPIEQLKAWLQEAEAAPEVIEPHAMCLSTVSREGKPSSRFVLLRDISAEGLTFFSNYESRKAGEMADNRAVCTTFWWASLERQVRVEGVSAKVSREKSEAYFRSRPRESQIASMVSPQSRVIKSREALEAMVEKVAASAPDPLELPDNWGGYLIKPERFEFWQGRAARLHDRIIYRREGPKWVMERLAP